MKSLRQKLTLTAALVLSAAAPAFAQPKIVATGFNNGGITADGNTVTGILFYADLELTDAGSYYRPYKFTRGVGFQAMGDRPMQSSPAVSADGSAACGVIYNQPENWANFETLYPYGPNPTIRGHTLTGRWTAPGGWVNEGSFPNVGGQGAARCDQPLNAPADISGDGRFIAGWAHYGTFGGTDCKFYPAVFDSNLGVAAGWSRLPFRNNGIQPASLPHTISDDGRVIEGYDMGDAPQTIPGQSPPIQNARSLTVWERTDVNQPFPADSATILDYWGAGSGEGQLNGPGNIIAGYLSTPTATFVECNEALRGSLVRYVKTAPLGACCFSPSASTCIVSDAAACELRGGWYAGTGVTCEAASCTGIQFGSCCTTLRGCNITNYLKCQCTGGTFASGGTCTPSPCPGTPELAACCAGTLCQVVDKTFCRNVRGKVYSGVTTCSPSPCPASPWYREILGRVDQTAGNMVPIGISDDGNTIVGAVDGVAFIWRPTLNEGVPMLLSNYLVAQNGGQPFPGGGFVIGQLVGAGGGVGGLSGNGNAVIVSLINTNNTCTNGANSHVTGASGILYLDGSAIPCDPPRIAVGPRDQIVHNVYATLGTPCNVFASGSMPLTYEWQMAPTPTGPWTTPTESCSNFTPPFDFEGVHSVQLRIGGITHSGYYRVVISNSCGTVASDPAHIQFASGACCHNLGGELVCTIEAANECSGSPSVGWLGGTYAGDFTTCSPTPADPCANSTGNALIGACCYYAGGTVCVVDVGPHCTLATNSGGYAGTFAGPGTTCTPTACNAVAGACCYSLDNYSSAVCTVELSSRCTTNVASGGVAGAYLGNGTTCSANACASVAGACCYAPSASEGVICTIQTQTRCTNLPQLPSQQNYFSGLQGIYVGNGATCSPSDLCSVVSGACCYSTSQTSSAICTIQLQDKCTRASNNNGLGGAYKGDSTTCTPTACNNVTGACCYSTFNDSTTLYCTIQPANHCTTRFNTGGLFGYYMGANTTCSPTACTAVVGACCFIPPNEQCYVCAVQPKDQTGTGSLRCTDPINGGLGGTFAGVNTVCTPSNCNLQSGACCLGGSCTVICVSICTANAGDYRGDNTTCSPDPCGAPEACCAANGSCTLVAAASCIGTPMGSGSTCTPNPCPGACCCGSHCSITTAVACVGTGKRFVGGGTACTPYSLSVPCCRGDYNKNAVGASISVQDIFDFLTGYFSVDTCADSNDSGTVSVQDIFDFLSAYFGGC